MDDRYDRRRVLALGGLGLAGLAGLAGCLGGGPAASTGGNDGSGGSDGANGGGDGGTNDGTGGDTGGSDAGGDAGDSDSNGDMGGDDGTNTATDGSADAGVGGSSIDHPAATDIESQPRLGDLSAPATIIAFEDPSCTRCRAFERNTVPQIKSDLIEPGTASFVVRTYPVIYPWGEPAVQALEATFARDADAFWGLFDHYFAEQDAFSTDTVLSLTAEWLAANTDLDADAVVADAEAKAYDDAVQADLAAGQAAGAGRTTPAVFLFRDGEYRTKAQGSVSFDLIRSALDV